MDRHSGKSVGQEAPHPSSSSQATEGNDSDDARLVASIGEGDGAALTAVYDRYSGIVYSVALRVLADTSAAEDVLQEIFLRLWRDPARFKPARGSLPAWLAVMARNRAIDQLRRRRPADDVTELPVACSLDIEDLTARRDVIANARQHMATLPDEQRRTIEMAFFEGLTHNEIAERTGEPLGTIKTRIRSGIQSIRRALAL